jgi:pyruvate dehydrogenase E1 component alpha subunit
MCQLWKIPCIFVVENNGYAMGTAVQRHSTGEIWERALAYGMKHRVFNGMDVLTVYENMKEIAAEVRKDSMPWFVEIRTYRYRGHSMSDPQKYRTKEEMDEFQQLDPIERLRTLLLSDKSVTAKKLEAIEKEVEEEVLDAVAFADEAPFPEPEALYEDMFSGDNPIFHT